MPADEATLDALVDRFELLGAPDRAAVLAALGPAERGSVDDAIAARQERRQAETAAMRRAGRQFAGYSPWLADVVRQASAGESDPAVMTEAARRAVAEAHAALTVDDEGVGGGWLARLRNLTARIVDGRSVES